MWKTPARSIRRFGVGRPWVRHCFIVSSASVRQPRVCARRTPRSQPHLRVSDPIRAAHHVKESVHFGGRAFPDASHEGVRLLAVRCAKECVLQRRGIVVQPHRDHGDETDLSDEAPAQPRSRRPSVSDQGAIGIVCPKTSQRIDAPVARAPGIPDPQPRDNPETCGRGRRSPAILRRSARHRAAGRSLRDVVRPLGGHGRFGSARAPARGGPPSQGAVPKVGDRCRVASRLRGRRLVPAWPSLWRPTAAPSLRAHP